MSYTDQYGSSQGGAINPLAPLQAALAGTLPVNSQVKPISTPSTQAVQVARAQSPQAPGQPQQGQPQQGQPQQGQTTGLLSRLMSQGQPPQSQTLQGQPQQGQQSQNQGGLLSKMLKVFNGSGTGAGSQYLQGAAPQQSTAQPVPQAPTASAAPVTSLNPTIASDPSIMSGMNTNGAFMADSGMFGGGFDFG